MEPLQSINCSQFPPTQKPRQKSNPTRENQPLKCMIPCTTVTTSTQSIQTTPTRNPCPRQSDQHRYPPSDAP
ncbi:hypothetical protein C7212DRAFT_337608 [Tuber magnatum]|uniref:Uncharacterized protein n=1 Tax=Tuber magnatum TaxID=42249 RepID=A0A317SCA0_9PEZI|nr:hypothetical protein C7212DRAFT_337608 [Tuber magnatum]